MPLDPETRKRIESLVQSNEVVLFMKGTRQVPQCGFSAATTQILDSLVDDYATVDVLADPDVRDGIKQFSSWPTIPQLYVKGEFIGGCDIVRDLYESGDLHGKLGVPVPERVVPSLAISDGAAQALRAAAEQNPGKHVHLEIDAGFEHSLFLSPPQPGAVEVESNGIKLYLDPASAQRAEGLSLDVAPNGQGFVIQNPSSPGQVRALSAAELKAKLDAGEALLLFDVRTPEERATAHIEGSRLLDEPTAREAEKLDKDSVLVFHCHHGGRSQAAAEHFASLGFRNVYNLTGGIDAWSQEVDPSVPRY